MVTYPRPFPAGYLLPGNILSTARSSCYCAWDPVLRWWRGFSGPGVCTLRILTEGTVPFPSGPEYALYVSGRCCIFLGVAGCFWVLMGDDGNCFTLICVARHCCTLMCVCWYWRCLGCEEWRHFGGCIHIWGGEDVDLE